MAETRPLQRFPLDPTEDIAFIQNNGDGTFSFGVGAEGIHFSLSDKDFVELVTCRERRRIILTYIPEDRPVGVCE